jgi:8-oxo-dGTP pyrophosphatase MutT (NUDIX family)
MTPQNTILLVRGRRSGKWSFPKGHKIRSETYLNCALRETQEETGLDLSDSIPVAYHKLSVGEYFFFEMDDELSTEIQDTTEVAEARWVSLEDIADLPCNVDVNNFLSRLSRSFRRSSLALG